MNNTIAIGSNTVNRSSIALPYRITKGSAFMGKHGIMEIVNRDITLLLEPYFLWILEKELDLIAKK